MPERELRRTRLAHLLAFAFMPVGMGAIILAFGEGVTAALILPVVPFLVSAYRLGTAKCPQCGEHFFWSFERGSNPLAHHCLHCRHRI